MDDTVGDNQAWYTFISYMYIYVRKSQLILQLSMHPPKLLLGVEWNTTSHTDCMLWVLSTYRYYCLNIDWVLRDQLAATAHHLCTDQLCVLLTQSRDLRPAY